ncbi:MAG: leucyl aminopeptidase family protein [Planctomycetes bacterium]|nr:leucyl aminopeptidase family protein [Planctomycetota bacterium]HPF13592.1 leucyl aminopeptidase family protein [Planctomycetota bacterium]
MDALLKGTDTLLIVGSQAVLKQGERFDQLPEELMRLAVDLATDLAPGDMGTAAGTLTGTSPRKLALGMLPDTLSRHNSPTRSLGIQQVVAQSQTGKKGNAAILLYLDDASHYPAAAAAIARCLPLFSEKSSASPKATLKILALGPDDEPIPATKAVQTRVEMVRLVASWVDMPPSDCNPAYIQKAVWALLKGIPGVTKTAIVGDKLLTAGLGGIHGVGRTAPEAPRLLVLNYKPTGRAKGSLVALVGKGVTYDTGGLSLKVGGSMVNMKTDMGGAAAVFGAFLELVQTGCKRPVSALLCLAENSIGPNSYRPDDILKMHSGKSVEINNTDAEGRLLLGDGVSYAARKLKAAVILDAATLTGAQLVATGKAHAAVVTNEESLETGLIQAGKLSGELVHPLPFAPELYKKEFASQVADMKNSVADRMNAQSSCAAQFVYNHLDGQKVAWGHVDLAGPASIKGRATGFGVGLLAETVRAL